MVKYCTIKIILLYTYIQKEKDGPQIGRFDVETQPVEKLNDF